MLVYTGGGVLMLGMACSMVGFSRGSCSGEEGV